MAQRLMSVMAVLAWQYTACCAPVHVAVGAIQPRLHKSLCWPRGEMLTAIMANLKQPPAGAGATESELWQPLSVKLVDSENHAVAGTVTCSGKNFRHGRRPLPTRADKCPGHRGFRSPAHRPVHRHCRCRQHQRIQQWNEHLAGPGPAQRADGQLPLEAARPGGRAIRHRVVGQFDF